MRSVYADILDGLIIAVDTVFTLEGMLLIAIGVVFGVLMGVFPGLSGTTALALLIPLTFGMDTLPAFILLTATLGGTNFGGSLTSILINTPGSSVNAATLLDGFPMTQRGEAGRAIGASAMASASGAILGVILLFLAIPILIPVILLFSPPEIFWLGIWGLTVIALIVGGAVTTGLIAAGVGLLFAMHGRFTITGTARWTYDQSFMLDGVSLVPALIGLFAIAEMVRQMGQGQSIADTTGDVFAGRWQGIVDVWNEKFLWFRSAIVGAVIGVVPGVGGSAANFIAYFQALQTAPNAESFGTGDVRGVIAAEASNDAKDGTGFLPTLGFGIPGSASMAVLLGAFVLHGITPGPLLLRENMELVMIIIVSLIISNILTSILGVLTAPYLVRVTRIDIAYIAPVILSIAVFAAYAIRGNIFDLYIALFFGILGFMLIKLKISRIPLLLGLILGPIVENNYHRSLLISQGDYAIFWRSNLALILIALVIVSLLYPLFQNR